VKRDREVLDLLRDEPELLAIADAVAETEAPRRFRPPRALIVVVTLGVALIAIVVVSQWDRVNGDAAVETGAPILVRGIVLGPDCSPETARVGVFVSQPEPGEQRHVLGPEIASVRSGADGRFTLRADPATSPLRERVRAQGPRLTMIVEALSTDGTAYKGVSRLLARGRWWEGQPSHPAEPSPVRIQLNPKDGMAARC
jgi:hypothetical protein